MSANASILSPTLSSQKKVDDNMYNGGLLKNNHPTNIITNGFPSFEMSRAPPHVYSCFVVNDTAQPVKCILKYNGRQDETKFDEVVTVTISGKAEHYFPRQFFQPELPDSYCKWVKIITHIQVTTVNNEILEVQYPFEHVHYPVRNWEFHIQDKGDIVSKPPTRVVNVLKYENLDRYEC